THIAGDPRPIDVDCVTRRLVTTIGVDVAGALTDAHVVEELFESAVLYAAVQSNDIVHAVALGDFRTAVEFKDVRTCVVCTARYWSNVEPSGVAVVSDEIATTIPLA